jgi:hypothetical protein
VAMLFLHRLKEMPFLKLDIDYFNHYLNVLYDYNSFVIDFNQ